MQLNHLHLHVRDLKASQQFYERWFGFREHVRHGPILFLRDSADLDLALMPDEAAAPLPSWFHFGFRLSSAEAVTTLHQRMKDAEVPIVADLQSWEDFVVYRCEDPDGHAIEIYWE